MQKANLEELLAAGVHFGHKTWRINPKSKKYIFKIERGSSIIDLIQTASELNKALEYVHALGKENKILLVVATKKQAKIPVSELCNKYDISYFTNKWVGGFLTNFEEVYKNIKKMQQMKQEKDDGAWNKLPKHEMIKLQKILSRIERIYQGVSSIDRLPDALFIIDVKKEDNTVSEAIRRHVKTVAVVDTNSDPSLIDFPIPGNDDAITSISYLTEIILKAYSEGKDSASDDKKK